MSSPCLDPARAIKAARNGGGRAPSRSRTGDGPLASAMAQTRRTPGRVRSARRARVGRAEGADASSRTLRRCDAISVSRRPIALGPLTPVLCSTRRRLRCSREVEAASHRLFLDRGVLHSSGGKGEVDRIPRELINPLCESEARHGTGRTTRRETSHFPGRSYATLAAWTTRSQVDGRGDMAGFSPCLPAADMGAVLAPPTVTHDGAAYKSQLRLGGST